MTEAIGTASAIRDGFVEPSAFWGLMVIHAILLMTLAVGCTAASALGAGLRLLTRRILGSPRTGGDEEGRTGWFSRLDWRGVAAGVVVALIAGGLLTWISDAAFVGTDSWGALQADGPDAAAALLALIAHALVSGVVIGFAVSLLGGYLAGRLAGERGGVHGLLVAGIYLVSSLAVNATLGYAAGLVAPAGGEPLPEVDPASIGLAVGFALFVLGPPSVLLFAFLGGFLGGKLGTRRSDTRIGSAS